MSSHIARNADRTRYDRSAGRCRSFGREGCRVRTRWFILAIGAGVVAILFAFPLWWPLINRSVVAEVLPGLMDLPPDEQPVVEAIAAEDRAFAEALIATSLAAPVVVPEADQAMPDMQGPLVYATGEFTEIDAVRRASGTVTVYEEANGSWVIRLENFEVRHGPQLHLYFSMHESPRTLEELREGGLSLDWGPLQGTVGSQNYRLPAGTDMSQIESLVIFSVTYQEIFSTAQLFRQ